MDCRRAKELIPLWIGQDLPDATTAAEIAKHLERCLECEKYRSGLQTSLDLLQSSSAQTLSGELAHRSVWPKLASQIAEWDRGRHQDRFNGWIPASVMALAVALMIAVSLPSIRDELLGDSSNNLNTVNLFDVNFNLDSELKLDEPTTKVLEPQRRPLGTPVNFKLDQW